MPVYWFALSFVEDINVLRAVAVFVILHLLVYPSSNGYNSFMDRDENSIGGLKKPLQPTKQLFMATLVLDVLALLSAGFISAFFAGCILFYIICSRLYSYRSIRLKQYPVIGYLTVIFNQGTLTFLMVYHGCDEHLSVHAPWPGLLAAAFLIGGFYPITQVYQHEEDRRDGIITLSMLLGKRGTFIYCSLMYSIALAILWMFYNAHQQRLHFVVLVAFFIPVVISFTRWFLLVVKDERLADFEHTMKMNWLASTCTNVAFITIIFLQQFWQK